VKRGRSLIIITGAGVVGAVLLVVLALQLASSPEARKAIIKDRWVVGRADSLAKTIRTGGPILFPDPRGGTRDIYVQHVGPSSKSGWSSFEARAGGTARTCQLRWDKGRQRFVDPCSTRVYPADGEGLTAFPSTLDSNGLLTVDLSP
jgi:hypothetical protein